MTRAKQTSVAIIGAGIAGLASAVRLAHAGCDVTVFEAQDTLGGKMRVLPSDAGPVDTGPTVLTMRPVFEQLFADVGLRLSDHVTLTPLTTLARHYWDDGTQLDLMADEDASADNIAATFGAQSAGEYRDFAARARRLFDAFDAPMMQSAAPSQWGLTQRVIANPRLLADMAPHRSLWSLLHSSFTEPKLAQLFARYATYVGGLPAQSPALLSLISDAEARGVWAVEGGMHHLACVLAKIAEQFGATFRTNSPIEEITVQNGQATGVIVGGAHHAADIVLFNGDPRALALGHLGDGATSAVPRAVDSRSLSAWVHAFAATPQGVDLAYHTVFFGHDPRAEFDALAQGKRPTDASLYICAQDRAGATRPTGPERFEIILNGAPNGDTPVTTQEIEQCQTQVFHRLETYGLTFDRTPGPETLSTPHSFAMRYPGSAGSLYGQSPHGLTAGLKRPTARTKIAGLYLCGGGAHPGAGVPMATLSARHAVEAILADQTSTSQSRQTATRGGTSTASAPAAPAPSRSSAS